MTKDINKLKFNFTSQMASLLLKYNCLKKEYNETKDPKLLEELKDTKEQFIKSFRESNKKEIEEFMELKDQL